MCVSAKTVGNRRDGTRLLMDLIKLNKDGLHHGHFAVFDVSRSEQTALNLSTDQSVSKCLLVYCKKDSEVLSF